MSFILILLILLNLFFLKVFSEDPVNFPGCGATHIVQIAAPRTASSFGWYILCSIMRVCAKRIDPEPPVYCYDIKKNRFY